MFRAMPLLRGILELPHPFTALHQHAKALFFLSVFAGSTVAAQSGVLPQASDLDWISWEYLSPEQKALNPDQCCGMYVDPAMTDFDGDPGSVNLSADKLDISDRSNISL